MIKVRKWCRRDGRRVNTRAAHRKKNPAVTICVFRRVTLVWALARVCHYLWSHILFCLPPCRKGSDDHRGSRRMWRTGCSQNTVPPLHQGIDLLQRHHNVRPARFLSVNEFRPKPNPSFWNVDSFLALFFIGARTEMTPTTQVLRLRL